MAENETNNRWQRATKDDQKQQRRQEIMEVAWQRFQDSNYQAITMSEVAEKSGLAKGTLYLYFKTKEELFLAIQEQQLTEWFSEVNTRLDELIAKGQQGVTAVKRVFCESLNNREHFVRLLAILHIVLEQNIEIEAARRFKHFTLAHLLETGTRLEQVLPFLGNGQGARLILQIYALVIGLQNLADPAPVVWQALQEPGLELMIINFKQEFAEIVENLLIGLASRNRVLRTED